MHLRRAENAINQNEMDYNAARWWSEGDKTNSVFLFSFFINVGQLPLIRYHTFANLQEQAMSASVWLSAGFISSAFALYRRETRRCASPQKI